MNAPQSTAGAEADAQRIVDLVHRHRLPLTDEKATQAAFAELLEGEGFKFDREFRLSDHDIPDFLVGSHLAIELKVKGGKRNIYRQLKRYADHGQVHVLLLVSNVAMGLPETIEGKPVYMASLGRAWL